MKAILPFLIAGTVGAVLLVLLFGIGNMVRRNHSPRTSNRLMQWRVGLQLSAILLIVALMLLSK
jgi:uncharacterized PurR-regulated membrane protein YhhQ (DUF165 family)